MHLTDARGRHWNNWSAPESRLCKSAIPNPLVKRQTAKNEAITLSPAPADVHKKNLSAIAFPLVFLFSSFHFVIFELYCVFVHAIGVLAFIFIWLRRKWRHWTSVTVTGTTIPPVEQCDSHLYQYERDEHDQPIVFNSILYYGENQSLAVAEEEMWRPSDHSEQPGCDALSRQKQHEKRAFELISKALILDEQNGGKLTEVTKLSLSPTVCS